MILRFALNGAVLPSPKNAGEEFFSCKNRLNLIAPESPLNPTFVHNMFTIILAVNIDFDLL